MNHTIAKIYFFAFLLMLSIILLSIPGYSQTFRFDDQPGDIYNLETYSIQEIWIDNLHEITMDQKYDGYYEVTGREGNRANITGEVHFYMREHLSTEPYVEQNESITHTEFTRAPNGTLTVGPRYFYPVVRNIPVFPQENYEIGDYWEGIGFESQDFREVGVPVPYIVPLEVRYEYVRDDFYNERECAVIRVHYFADRRDEDVNIGENPNTMIPVRAFGYLDGEYYWDKEKNMLVYYEGDYDFIYIFSNGAVIEYIGHDYGTIEREREEDELIAVNPNITPERREDILEEFEEELQNLESHPSVELRDDEIVVTLGDVLFRFDSTELTQDATLELDRISQLLLKYDNFNIRVEGHTDNIGGEQINQEYSEERAQNVADYLMMRGVDSENVNTEGFGFTRPIAPNTTAEGRRLNRRVEIILETSESEIEEESEE